MWNILARAKPVNLLKSFINSNKSYFVVSQLRKFGADKNPGSQKFRIKTTLYYFAGLTVMTVGMSYAAVPLYRMFCQAYAYGGTTGVVDGEKVQNMTKVPDRIIKIKFNADLGASMRWNFKPQQFEIKVNFHNTLININHLSFYLIF